MPLIRNGKGQVVALYPLMPFGLFMDLWECHKQYNGIFHCSLIDLLLGRVGLF